MSRIDTYRNNYQKYLNFTNKYKKAVNASSGSEVDSNANVESKNITTMSGELPKKEIIGTNRLLMAQKLIEMHEEELAERYIDQVETHKIYKHDETSMMPYTYLGQESVFVLVDDIPRLTTLERLYDICDEKEFLLDSKNDVYAKYPKNIRIQDRDGFTNITRLVKKRRHRDLVSVKTRYGENVIVTDNHPMIVSDGKNDTVEAVNSTGRQQYRQTMTHAWPNNTVKKWSDTPSVDVETYLIHKGGNYVHFTNKEISVNEKLGYFIGYFIAEGWFAKKDGADTSIMIKSKDLSVLKKCASYVFETCGCYSNIYETDRRGVYTLTIRSEPLLCFMKDHLGIVTGAYHKVLPHNIYCYSKEFAQGIVAGIIDGDGTVSKNGQVAIRLTSRACISQLSHLLGSLELGSAMMYQDYSQNTEREIKSRYPMFGVAFYANRTNFPLSEKLAGFIKAANIRYQSDVWADIVSVTKIENNCFLKDCNYIYDITTESNTFMLNNLWVHNCVSISMYPFLLNGLENIGGTSGVPKHLSSFCGEFINLVFAVASQFAGAVSTPEFLTYMDYFLRKDYGEDYYLQADEIVGLGNRPQTIDMVITDAFQQVVHSLNQPAAARNFQSVFWNIAYFDEPYFEGIFDNFVFPDGTEPKWESVSWLQKRFMKWFNEERTRKILTFPVETLNLLNDGEKCVDGEWADFAAEMYAEGHSYFTYTSDSVDSLASCCRLKNQIVNNTFSFTLGAGGVSTGSKGVITININRLVQDAVRDNKDISEAVREQVRDVHKYLLAYNEIVKDWFKSHLLPIYEAGYIKLDRQYLTIGINGFVEGAEFLGIDISPNENYFAYGEKILKPIYEENRKAKTSEVMFNTEFVPAENLGVKNAAWDKKDGYFVPRDCYNSYFYRVEDEDINILDKFILHGDRLTKYLDGGSALHCNLDEHLTKEQYKKLMDVAIKTGCSYFTYNIPNTICNNCMLISKHKLEKCPRCGSEDLDYATRIIGYLKRVSRFSEARQKEAVKRYYADGKTQIQ